MAIIQFVWPQPRSSGDIIAFLSLFGDIACNVKLKSLERCAFGRFFINLIECYEQQRSQIRREDVVIWGADDTSVKLILCKN